MERYFRTVNGQLVNIMTHIIEEVERNPQVRIRIGTDSQNTKKSTEFATVIVFRYGKNGAHYIYLRQRVKKIKDRFTRLFEEAEKTIQLAEMITGELPISIEALEFDYNARLKTESTKVIPAARGWAESLGYRVLVKEDLKPGDTLEDVGLLAIKAADHICRN
jgi:hypothetical protein